VRITILLVIFLLAALRSAPAQDALRVGLFPNVTHAQGLIAANMSREGKGWFESRVGVPKIEWFVYNAGPSAMEGLFTKAVDFTYVGPSPAVNAYARANGKVVRVISGAMRGGSALVVSGTDIQKPDDLRGKVIATPQLGNTQDVECRAWLIEHGIKVTLVGGDAKVIPTANPDILSLFRQNKLNAAWTVEPWVTRLITEGGGRLLFEEKDSLTTILTVRQDLLENRRELVQKFAAAHRELTQWMLDHPEEARKRVRDELTAISRKEIPLALIEEAWTRLRPSNEVSVEPFEKFLDQARLVGFLRAQVNLSKLVETQP
jgi:NitT/TauT family transport system substrate-binding protein